MNKRLINSLLIGALLSASTGVFVSCADYDDDINANKAEIVAAKAELSKLTTNLDALKSELATTKANLEKQLKDETDALKTQIADAKASLQTAINAKADQSTVDELAAKVVALEKDLAATESALQAKIDAVNTAIDNLKQIIATKADQSALDAAIATIQAALNGKVDKETYAEAVARISALETNFANLKTLIDELKAEKATYADVNNQIANINKDIEALQQALATKVSSETFNNAIDNLKASLATIQSTLATKADAATVEALKADLQKQIDAVNAAFKNYVTSEQLQKAIDQINTVIASLQNNKADKAEVAELKALVVTIQATVADLQNNKADKEAVNAAIESLRNEVKALVASKADQTEIVRLDNLIEKLQELVDTKANAEDVEAADAALALLIAALDANKASKEELAAAQTSLENALAAAVKTLNESIALKADQKDLEAVRNDLTTAQQDITTILGTLASVQGDLEGVEKKFDKLIADLQGQDTQFAEELKALREYAAAKTELEAQKKALETYEATMNKRAQDIEDALSKASQELKDQIAKEEADRKAAITEVYAEISKVQGDLNTKYGELNAAIKAGDEALANKITEEIGKSNARIKALEDQFAKLNELIDARVNEHLNNLWLFVDKSLKSISLVPQLYINGIEAIEFNSLTYRPLQPGKSGLGDATLHSQYKTSTSWLTIDNGTAEAYYRLNPSSVKRESIDEDNIEYYSAISETRATTPAYGVEKPVEFAGIAAWNYNGKAGLVKVNLRKTITGSLNRGGNEIFIVALKVPRKEVKDAAGNVVAQAANIVSENSMLVENTFTPRIARLTWNSNEKKTWKGLDGVVYPNGYRVHHYTDSVTIFQQDIDVNQLVYHEVNWNQTLNVRNLVTGCILETPKDKSNEAGIGTTNHAASNEVSKDKLSSFGLEFRFAIPTKLYNDVDHQTNQQQFAVIDPVTGILSSTVPQVGGGSITDNRACVGKEPIIRIMLIDTNNGNLVDERYMKIKWVEPTKGTKDLGEYAEETTLKPCTDNVAGGVKWLWFIDKAYSQAEIQGMSQATFAAVYMDPAHLPTVGTVSKTWANGNNASHLSLLSPAVQPGGPSVKQTTNENGDALIASWTLTPQEIANIYPQQSKVFTAVITFHSILPTEYPDLTMTYKWTIKLPSLPAINGYYDNYWFTKYTLHDVMPVQYNTAMYNAIKNGTVLPGKSYGIAAPAVGMQLYDKANNKYYPGTDYCVFYNNITNPFTYEIKSGTPHFIVKNLLGACSTWDMQFTWNGPDAIEAMNMTWNSGTNKWSGSPISGAKTYPQIAINGQYRPASNTNSPALSKINWKGAGAYKLENAAGAQALQLEWWGQINADGMPDQADEAHIAWDGLRKYNYAILYADHHNSANQALLNKLLQENEADGWTPVRTHTNKVHMGIWGTLNDWNIIPVKDYDLCLVEPLRINATLTGAFEEGFVSGTCIKNADAFAMRDFRGYEVKDQDAPAGASERVKYRKELYRYYEVGTPVWNLADVKYGMKYTGGKLVASDTDKLTANQIKTYTNGNIVLSVEQKTWLGEDYLVFKNNGGSNVEEEVWVYIPVTVDYGFGKVSTDIKVKLYPKGKAGSATIVPYPGNN